MSEDVSATASCFVMHNVELPSQKDRREKLQAELSYEELNAVWFQYLSTSVERLDFARYRWCVYGHALFYHQSKHPHPGQG